MNTRRCRRCGQKFIYGSNSQIFCPNNFCLFWKNVDKKGGVPDHAKQLGSCWRWKLKTYGFGYGQFTFKGVSHRAHRFSWEISHGPIPEGMWVLHRCDNPKCVNPGHLFLGTSKDNQLDCVAKGRAIRAVGSKHGRAVLSESDVLYIRKNYKWYVRSMKSLAKQFRVSVPTIKAALCRVTWKHI